MGEPSIGETEGRFAGIFLSAVTSEFGVARDQLAKDLHAAKKFEVWVQEEFAPEGGGKTMLGALDNYIKGCNTVYCVVGKRSGEIPPTRAAAPFADQLPKELDEASYTQWEYILARHYRTDVVIFRAVDDYTPDKKPGKKDDPKLQKKFLKHYFVGKKSEGRAWTGFSNVDELARHALKYRESGGQYSGGRRSGTSTDDGLDLSEKAAPKVSDRTPTGADKLPSDPLIGRDQEVSRIVDEIGRQRDATERLVMLIGPEGIGRRSLLREAVRRVIRDPSTFPNGVAYPDLVGVKDSDDFTLALWDEFFTTRKKRFTPDPRQCAKDLSTVEALILVPAEDPFVEDIGTLKTLMPNAVVCTWAVPPKPNLAGGRLTIRGLEPAASCKVFTDKYEHDVPEEAETLLQEKLRSETDGHPGAIIDLAEEARDETYHSDEDARQRLFMEWVAQGVSADASSTPESEPAAGTT
jgi:hypothetical protein